MKKSKIANLKSFTSKDFLRKINNSKTYTEQQNWITAYKDWREWQWKTKERMSKHFNCSPFDIDLIEDL